jgi:hypothetical protein
VIRVSFDAQLGDCNNNNEKNLMCYVFFFLFIFKEDQINTQSLVDINYIWFKFDFKIFIN